MSDLDELERVCNEKTRWPTCGEVLSLLSRCRTAEADAELRKAAAESLTQQVLDLKARADAETGKARRYREGGEELARLWAKDKARAEAAERERDEAKAWIEYHVRERAEERDEARAEAERFHGDGEMGECMRWMAAVEKVRGRYPETAFPPEGKSLDCNSARMARLACDEITRLATERREGEHEVPA